MKKKVYICAPLGGNVKENLENAILYTKYALMQGVAPVTTHFYALCLDDNNPQDRALGVSAGMSVAIDNHIKTCLKPLFQPFSANFSLLYLYTAAVNFVKNLLKHRL